MVDGVKQTFSRIGNSISGTSGQDTAPATTQVSDAKQADTANSTSFLDTLISGASTAANLLQQADKIQQSVTQLSNAATLGSSALDAGSLQSGMNALRSGTRALQSGAQAVQAGSTLITGARQTNPQQANNPPQDIEEPVAESVPDSPQEICKVAHENMVKAELRYIGKKILHVPAEFESVNRSIRASTVDEAKLTGSFGTNIFRAKLFAVKPDKKRDDSIEIYAHTLYDSARSLQEVGNISKGEHIKVTGIIDSLTKPHETSDICQIVLNYARFEKTN